MDRMFLCCGGCNVHCQMFNSAPHLYPLDARWTPLPPPLPPQLWQLNKSLHISTCRWGVKSLPMEKQESRPTSRPSSVIFLCNRNILNQSGNNKHLWTQMLGLCSVKASSQLWLSYPAWFLESSNKDAIMWLLSAKTEWGYRLGIILQIARHLVS